MLLPLAASKHSSQTVKPMVNPLTAVEIKKSLFHWDLHQPAFAIHK